MLSTPGSATPGFLNSSFRTWSWRVGLVIVAALIITPVFWFVRHSFAPKFSDDFQVKHMLQWRLDLANIHASTLELHALFDADTSAAAFDTVTDILLAIEANSMQAFGQAQLDSLEYLSYTQQAQRPRTRLLFQIPVQTAAGWEWPNLSLFRQLPDADYCDGLIIDMRDYPQLPPPNSSARRLLDEVRQAGKLSGLRLAGIQGVGLAAKLYAAGVEGKVSQQAERLVLHLDPDYVILDGGAGLLPNWIIDAQQIEQTGQLLRRATYSTIFLAREPQGDAQADSVYANSLFRTALAALPTAQHCEIGLLSAAAPGSGTFGVGLGGPQAVAQQISGQRIKNGKMLLMGGGPLESGGLMDTLVAHMPNRDSLIVVIPSAMSGKNFNLKWPSTAILTSRGVNNIHVMHTRDRLEADSPEFAAPLFRAHAVLILGGRQWRLTQAYGGTRVVEGLESVLERGGIVAGTSAGASALASFLVRGHPGDNAIMIGEYTAGFGLLENIAVDQHLFRRGRERDLIGVLRTYPQLLGIGIDEEAGILVEADTFRVVGNSNVAVYDSGNWCLWPGRFQLLPPGSVYNMRQRRSLTLPGEQAQVPRMQAIDTKLTRN